MLRRHAQLSSSDNLHFVTTVARQRGAVFVEDRVCTAVLQLFEGYRKKYRLLCAGYVLMPDHFHALLYQTDIQDGIIRCMRDFKKISSLKCRYAYEMESGLWRVGYDDVVVPGSHAADTKLKYIHHNPVKAMLVQRPEDYRWSSARDYLDIAKGIVEVTFL